MIPHEEIATGSEGKYYWLNVVCSNCGFQKHVAILKKNPIEECSCPICECYTIKKYNP